MINPISRALDRINAVIPYQLLELVFKAQSNGPFTSIALEQTIRDNVITRYVIPSCNLNGGRVTQIAIEGRYLEQTVYDDSQIFSGTGPFSIYRIPPEARDNTDIVEVMHVQYPTPFGNGQPHLSDGRGGSMCAYRDALLNSHTAGDAIKTPLPELLSSDLIRLHPGSFTHIPWVLTLRLAYDDDMTNLNSAAIESFSNLCLIATKRYIYNRLIINIDTGFIEGGAEIASIRAIVEQWSNVEQEYEEELTSFSNGNFLDVQRIGTLLAYML